MKLLCTIGIHDWRVVEEFHGYYTSLSWDTPGDMGNVHHGVFGERCARCGKHRLTATGEYHRGHAGIARLRKRWKAMEER